MRNIYVIDDDDDVRESLEALLSLSDHFVVRSFCTGDAFLASAEVLDTGILLLDFSMPGSSGIDVLRALPNSNDKFATIILTGEGNVTLAVEAMKAGAVDFVEKPYVAEKLLEAIDLAVSALERDSATALRVERAQVKIGSLSPRERDVLIGLIDGRANKVIAHELGLSPRTVEIYRANMMLKLQVRNLPDVMKIAFVAGMIKPRIETADGLARLAREPVPDVAGAIENNEI